MSDALRSDSEREVNDLLRRINQAWLQGRPGDAAQLFHTDIVMVFPGFAGRVQGREAMVNGLVDFCTNAQVHAFEEHDHQIDVIESTAVASFAFTMTYERNRQRFRSTGRDVWIFVRSGAEWLAVFPCSTSVGRSPAISVSR